ncbi:hypothetical protein [Thiobacillus denitrificans]|uniref:hypothetical protein n=1 Tax=Thiobacillus denitrificans TaxID=36861 RepID=UPI00036E02BC|nr:hypothetical protein [Thiobacillus denitrificans]
MKKLSKLKQAKRLLADITAPADPDVFIEMLDVFREATGTNGAVEGQINLDQVGSIGEGGKVPDTPLNRGMAGVYAALVERDVKAPTGYLVRLGALSQLFVSPEIVERYVVDGGENGEPNVNPVLLKAAAVARFSVAPKKFGFVIEDVLEKAANLESLEEDSQEAA